MTFKKSFSFLVLSLLMIPLLSGCFKKDQEPELTFDEVMRNAKQATMDIEFGGLQVDFSVKGQDAGEKIEGEGQIEFSFDRTDDSPEQLLRFVGQGEMQSVEGRKGLDIDVSFLEVRGVVQDELYMRLKKLNLPENPNFEVIQPLLQVYLGEWFKIPPQQLPETFQEFQRQQALLQEERERAKEIFVSTKLFNLQQYHGVEKAGKEKKEAYHYSIDLNEEGVKNYQQQVAQVLGQGQLTVEELQQVVVGIKYIQSIEVWIDTQTFRILQGKLTLVGDDLLQGFDGQAIELTVEVEMEGDFSTPVVLEAPEEHFDLDALGAFTQAVQLPIVQGVELESTGQ